MVQDKMQKGAFLENIHKTDVRVSLLDESRDDL
jgi:hypothetical protein